MHLFQLLARFDARQSCWVAKYLHGLKSVMHLRFSQDIKVLIEQLAERPLTLKDVLAETSERSFSLIIGLLVLPFIVPAPPGFVTIPGLACLLISMQMAIGRRSLWLPRRLAQFQFPKSFTLQLLKQIQHLSRWLEKVARPRWKAIAESRYAWQLNGICISWLTVLLMAPAPFTNTILTIAILLFVVATLETDGLLMCMAYGLTILITVLVGLVVYIVWQSPSLLQILGR